MKRSNLPATPPRGPDRQLQYPADDRGALISKLTRNSRGANTADPEIEHRQASLPAYIPVAERKPLDLGASERGTSGRG